MTTILPRRGTAAQWTAANPVLAMGELGFETDTTRWKRGDGVTAWTALAYYQPAWDDVTAKPAVIAAGADQTEARTAIGAADTAEMDAKVDKASTPNRIYVVDSGGNQSLIGYGTTAASLTIVRRDSNARTQFGYPVTSDDAATKGYVDTVAGAESVHSETISSTSDYTLPSGSTMFNLVLEASFTIVFPAPLPGKSITVFLKQDSVGTRTVTWPSSVKWQGATTPTQSATPNKTDIFSFIAVDSVSWFGFVSGKGF